jgi:diphosphomevalonate decarboxylase
MSRELRVRVRAPSNIAVVKYMGKVDSQLNLPSNGSLSLTLNALATDALFERVKESSEVRWSADLGAELVAQFQRDNSTGLQMDLPKLDEKGRSRMERHALRVREKVPAILTRHGFEVLADPSQVGFQFCAGNTFPAASGIASSASSFAAVTLGVTSILMKDPMKLKTSWNKQIEFRRELAELSRQGSGSSCRSFEGPWVQWENTRAQSVKNGLPEMVDLVVVVGKTPKDVSSSEAHLRVKTSPLWNQRVERVSDRLKKVSDAIHDGDFKTLASESWLEMWEMHSLFHTSSQPFTYWLPGSMTVLKQLMKWVERPELLGLTSPLLVTMDAGPNLHCLVTRQDASTLRRALQVFLREALPDAEILEDHQGEGAQILDVVEEHQ